jgi:AcrR family transcriptional regulator
MDPTVNPSERSRRAYHAPRRLARAAATRAAILAAARKVFIARGYRVATVADIAAEAAVAVDTVYATVGRKPALLRELVETAISGQDEAVPAEERDYVAWLRAAGAAQDKLAIYASAVTAIQQRLAPIFEVLRDAATTDEDCAALWRQIADRRARNMRLLAAELRATGQVRAELSDDDVADIIWSMNAAEYWSLLVRQRGWTPQRFSAFLTDAWTRLLLTGE